MTIDRRPTVTITRGQLEEWCGRPLTDRDIAALDTCIPNSSIPEAIATIAANALPEVQNTTVVITWPDGKSQRHVLTGDEAITVEVDGRELIGVIGDSGAGWWPTGDGGEHNGDWTSLQATS